MKLHCASLLRCEKKKDWENDVRNANTNITWPCLSEGDNVGDRDGDFVGDRDGDVLGEALGDFVGLGVTKY